MILDGKKLAEEILIEMKDTIDEISELADSPRLAIVTCGNDPASKVYVRNKIKAGEKCGIIVEHIIVEEDERLLKNTIDELNENTNLDGIIVQLPLPKGFNEVEIVDRISPLKDVDGLTAANIGRNLSNYKGHHFSPCTPFGIIVLLKYYEDEIDIENKNVLILGRSNLVGLPISIMMMQEFNCTPTICHSKTDFDRLSLKDYDIVISAVGKPKLFKSSDFKDDVILIDVGMNRDENGKLCGDIEIDKSNENLKFTPVPGGVGPMTVAMLMYNTLKSYSFNVGPR